ncbi:MAG: nitroreductase family deazaflavin-dependent oxidoreductase [Chloroflexi bacterium]|nr:nitroreductase family deazaflavin-dependent oxidoreductase [Chloroflexota bacterium]MDA1147547.1 nitroreductase family deazaflavin-dependent oxidoreductase [Chloroflexota bacterium]
MNRFVNPVVVQILRSPLQRLIPGVMLITVTGQRSGRRYTTPVQYARSGEHVYVLSRRGWSWWRNVRQAAPVTLRIRGDARSGTARALPASADAAAPALAAFRGSSLERGLSRLGDRAVIVAIDLDPA